MSILIKGMEMPKDRGVYIAIDNGEVFVKPLGALNWTRLTEMAVEIPPHGRLVDADALMCGMGDAEYKGAIKRVLMQAPTVIPAEEGEG